MPQDPERLTPIQARTIDAVARTGRIEHAASALNMSQSVVSRTVAAAEAKLGEPLFRRGWSGAELTASGEMILQRCSTALRNIAAAEDDMEAIGGIRPQLKAFLRWHQLEAVAAVVRSGSASGASVLLRVSQPAISRSLSAISGYCHQPLFHRRRGGLDATPQAEILATLHNRLARDLAIPADRKHSGACLSGRLAVGMLPFSGQDLIARAFGKLANRHPELRLMAVPGSYTMLAEALLRGEIDCMVGILRQPPQYAGLREVFLYNERYSLVAHRDHPCHAGRRTIDALKAERWIVAPHGTPIRTYFEGLFHNQGATPPAQTCEIMSFANAERVIAASDAIGLLTYSEQHLRDLGHSLRKVDVDLPDSKVAVGLTLRRDAGPVEILQLFETELKTLLQTPAADPA